MINSRESWRSRLGFIMATTGSAVGLGNIWRFPTTVGRNGGGAFVLVYLVIVVLIGVTAMIAEFALGRRTRQSPVGAFRALGPRRWWMAGALSVVAVFIILSFYSVIAGWTAAYVVKYWTGALTGLDAAGLETEFSRLVADPLRPLFWHFIFMVVTALVIARGVTGGIERWAKVLMPGILILLLLLLLRVIQLPGAVAGMAWLIRPDLARINFGTLLEATGQVFFSFSLGMGIMITYGSYLDESDNIPQSAVIIAGADVAVALLAGLIVIPAVFAFNVEPGLGPALVFVTIPAVFNSLPAGWLFGGAFFLMLSFAALTTTFSLLEVVVALIIDEWHWSRPLATAVAAAAIFLLGIPSALSQGQPGIGFFGASFLDNMDFLSSNVLLPISGILTAVFVGWVWGARGAAAELQTEGHRFSLAGVWLLLLRYLVPLAIAAVMIGRLFFG